MIDDDLPGWFLALAAALGTLCAVDALASALIPYGSLLSLLPLLNTVPTP